MVNNLYTLEEVLTELGLDANDKEVTKFFTSFIKASKIKTYGKAPAPLFSGMQKIITKKEWLKYLQESKGAKRKVSIYNLRNNKYKE